MAVTRIKAGASPLDRSTGFGELDTRYEPKRSNDPYTYYLNPGDPRCKSGEFVFGLSKAWHTPGLCGNGKSLRQRGAGFAKYQESLGRIEIPHAFPVEAWGEEITEPQSSSGSTYLVAYETRTELGVLVHREYREVWQRPERYGDKIFWNTDEAGYLDFLVRARDAAFPDGIPEQLKQMAIRAHLKKLQPYLRKMDTPRIQRQALQLILDIPKDYLPQNLGEILEEHGAAEKKGKKSKK